MFSADSTSDISDNHFQCCQINESVWLYDTSHSWCIVSFLHPWFSQAVDSTADSLQVSLLACCNLPPEQHCLQHWCFTDGKSSADGQMWAEWKNWQSFRRTEATSQQEHVETSVVTPRWLLLRAGTLGIEKCEAPVPQQLHLVRTVAPCCSTPTLTLCFNVAPVGSFLGSFIMNVLFHLQSSDNIIFLL